MSLQLSSSRMTSFSDGVIAVIITIMVLELKVPGLDVANFDGVLRVLPMLVIYAISFVQVGIYWVNHHYMMDDVEQVSHGMLCSNLGFLFALSLIPFGTAWLDERGVTAFAVSLYSVCCVLPAFTWGLLSMTIRRQTKKPPAGGWGKQLVSTSLYLGAIPVSYHSTNLAILMIAAVGALWLVPPMRDSEAEGGASIDPS
jgi:uncharacterized membrane protein